MTSPTNGALRGVITIKDKRFNIDAAKLDELPPGLRGRRRS